MSSFLVNIKDESKMDVLLIEKVGNTDIVLSDEQKQVLDHRRETAKPEDFINWKTAENQLEFKKK